MRRDHRHERPLGERAVADVAALRAAHEAGLADRERREVVVVEVALLGLEPERVEPHLLARGAERGHREGLRLAAREERRAVRARSDAHLDRDRRGSRPPSGRRGASCRPRSACGSMSFSSLSNASCTASRRSSTRRRRPRERRRPRGPPPRPSWSRPGARACPRPAWPGRARRRTCSLISLEQLLVDLRRRRRSAFSLPAFSASSRCAAQSFLISPCAMSSASRISASETSLAPASTIRIASSVPATTRSSSASRSDSSSGFTTNPPSSSLPMRTAPTGVGDGMSEIISAALAPFIARMS